MNPTLARMLYWVIFVAFTAIAASPSAVPAQSPPHSPLNSDTASPAARPISLSTALQLAGSNPIEVQLAAERVQLAEAQLDRSNVLWLPSLQFGADYHRHDGRLQDIVGKVFSTSKSSLMIGASPSAVFALTDAIYAPLAQRQLLRASRADYQTAEQDAFLAVATAYFDVQQARGECLGARDTIARAEALVRSAEKLAAKGVEIIASVEVSRAKAELSRRRQVLWQAETRLQVSTAELTRLLRLAPLTPIEPVESPHLRVDLLPESRNAADLLCLALRQRPELESRQALVAATIERIRQEKNRPLIPSLLLRGASTNPSGTLGAGYFGGGVNSRIGDFSSRSDFDVQVIWELQNLGAGNRAKVRERQSEHRLQLLELVRVQDRIASEVTQALAQVQYSQLRVSESESGLKEAIDSVTQNLAGLRQPKTAGSNITLINRPQEVVAAIQALSLAYVDFYGAISDANRAQARLYHALGRPASELAQAHMIENANTKLPSR